MAQAPDAVKQVPDGVKEIVQKLPLTDIDENALSVVDIRYLEDDRQARYAALCEDVDMGSADHVLSVECVKAEEADDAKIEDKEKFEKIIAITGDDVDVVEMEDKITMEDLCPSELIEYTFADQWMLAPMSLASLEGYRKMKFANWKHMIENPVCEAAFKRLLNIGLITNMFDHVAFPSPEDEKKDWIVQDEHGKDVAIPRPVKALRVWNVKERCFKDVKAHLDGAPSADEAAKYWEGMLAKFRNERGEDYINDLLASFKKE